MEKIENNKFKKDICEECIKKTCGTCFKEGLITEEQYIDKALSNIFN